MKRSHAEILSDAEKQPPFDLATFSALVDVPNYFVTVAVGDGYETCEMLFRLRQVNRVWYTIIKSTLSGIIKDRHRALCMALNTWLAEPDPAVRFPWPTNSGPLPYYGHELYRHLTRFAGMDNAVEEGRPR